MVNIFHICIIEQKVNERRTFYFPSITIKPFFFFSLHGTKFFFPCRRCSASWSPNCSSHKGMATSGSAGPGVIKQGSDFLIGYLRCVDEPINKWIHGQHLRSVSADSSKCMWRQSLPTARLAYDPYNGLFKVWLLFKPQCLRTTRYNIQKFCVLPTQFICVFRGTQNSDYFPV